MWIRFANDITVNMDAVIKYEKEKYGKGIIFNANGYGFVLRFNTDQELRTTLDEIKNAIIKGGVYEIPINPKLE